MGRPPGGIGGSTKEKIGIVGDEGLGKHGEVHAALGGLTNGLKNLLERTAWPIENR